MRGLIRSTRLRWLAIGLVVGAILASQVGCCTSEARRSASLLMRDVPLLNDLTVARPDLTPSQRDKVDRLKRAVQEHVWELGVEVGAHRAEFDGER